MSAMVRKEEEMEEATMTHDAGSNEQENAMEGEEEASEGELPMGLRKVGLRPDFPAVSAAVANGGVEYGTSTLSSTSLDTPTEPVGEHNEPNSRIPQTSDSL